MFTWAFCSLLITYVGRCPTLCFSSIISNYLCWRPCNSYMWTSRNLDTCMNHSTVLSKHRIHQCDSIYTNSIWTPNFILTTTTDGPYSFAIKLAHQRRLGKAGWDLRMSIVQPVARDRCCINLPQQTFLVLRRCCNYGGCSFMGICMHAYSYWGTLQHKVELITLNVNKYSFQFWNFPLTSIPLSILPRPAQLLNQQVTFVFIARRPSGSYVDLSQIEKWNFSLGELDYTCRSAKPDRVRWQATLNSGSLSHYYNTKTVLCIACNTTMLYSSIQIILQPCWYTIGLYITGDIEKQQLYHQPGCCASWRNLWSSEKVRT